MTQPQADTHPELPLDPDAVQPGFYKWPPHLMPLLQAVVFVGGCFGTLTRYGISTIIPVTENGWPLATFFVNLFGAFLLGLLLESLTRRGPDKGKIRLIRLGVGTGFIGAFTTYSSFAVESVLLYKNDHFLTAILYVTATLMGGLILCALGIFAGANHHKRQSRKLA